MCLAKAYIGGKGEKEPFLEDIASIKAEDGKLLVTTLFGEKREIAASIREIDFRASRVILERKD
ncbi:MAG TPA: CooT family nickel-binding protein [Dehalococcoidales bacterium]|nr:CooT family nickel-binding protein [Dehalococcoidales bacterium]